MPPAAMPPPQAPSNSVDPLYPELWRACAGPLVTVPSVGDLVFYFPQGHIEQVEASMNQVAGNQMRLYDLPSKLLCRVLNVELKAEADTDEVYAQIMLMPEPEQNDATPEKATSGPGATPRPAVRSFCKTLTASDTSTHGGFSVLRRHADECLPPLDMTQAPPTQELVAKDLHGMEWRFRHIFRGQPRRHLLQSGWSVFVSSKRLVAGDAFIFLRGENGLTISRPCLALSARPGRLLFFTSLSLPTLSATHLCRKKGARPAAAAQPRAFPRRAERLLLLALVLPPSTSSKAPPPEPNAQKRAAAARDKATRSAACTAGCSSYRPRPPVPIPPASQTLAKCGAAPLSLRALSLQGLPCTSRPYVRAPAGARARAADMSSPAGGGYGAGCGADHEHLLLGQAAGQLYHVPQHSRREKLRFPADPADPAAWPAPPPFYSYASSSTSSYSPHSPTLAHAQLVAHALPAGAGAQIPSQNFALSLSSASSNPPPAARRQLSAGVATGPYGPFTGYAAVLGRSRFLGPAQKLLEEICDVGGRPTLLDRRSDEGLLDMDVDHDMDGGYRAASEAVAVSGAEQQWRKTRLISLMEDVCRRYKQYYQQLQSVISSFESVAGLSNAAPFASMALRTMSKHFKCLKSMIMSQLRNTNKVAANDGIGKEDMANFTLMGGGAGLLRGNSLNAFSQPHNIWRPQRGLPERAVSVLRSWLFEHFLHPYPTDSDKQMLAKQTGLTRNQVSNWFINARVRLWKPMVEEIHNLEMRQLQKNTSLDKNQLGMQPQTQHSSDSSGKPSDPSSSSQRGQSSGMTRNLSSPASRHIQGKLPQMPHDMPGQVSFAYNGLPAHHGLALSHPQQQAEGISAGVGVGGAAANSGVSLTLGLHQNNRTYIAEPLPAALPLNLAHRFGLDDVSDAYVMGSFGGQERHFAKEMGGHHLVHDFVG